MDGKRKINIQSAEGHDARIARLNNRFLLNHLDLSKDFIITADKRIIAKDRNDDEGGANDANAEGDEAGVQPDEESAHGRVGDNEEVNNGQNDTNGADVHSTGTDKPKKGSGKNGAPRNDTKKTENARGGGRGGGAPSKPRRDATPPALVMLCSAV